MQLSDCVFCDIVDGIAPAEVVLWDSGNAVVFFKPLHPVTAGHLLAVPYRHVTDFAESPDVTASVARAASAFVLEGAWNLVTSKGTAATQSVFHLHVHLIPRTVDDQLMLPWGTTGNPHDPHWCKVAQRLKDQIDTDEIERKED